MTAASMTIAGNTTFLWEVQDAQAGPGVGGYDKMVITGSLDLTGATAINKITLKINSLTADGVTLDAVEFSGQGVDASGAPVAEEFYARGSKTWSMP
jgi:hypothetical protein